MATWITVYCRNTVTNISPEDLKTGLLGKDSSAVAGVDYRTLAEQYNIDPSLVGEAVRNIGVAETKGGDGWTHYAIRYGAEDTRPLLLYRWIKPARVAEELNEARGLTGNNGFIAHRLEETAEVIGIELGIGQLKDMGVVLAYEAARYFAQRGDGVILNDEGRWLTVADGAFQFIE